MTSIPEAAESTLSKQFNTRLPVDIVDKIEILRGAASPGRKKLSKTAYIIQLVEQDWTRNEDAVKKERVATAIANHRDLLAHMDDLIELGIMTEAENAEERRTAIITGLSELEILHTRLWPEQETTSTL